MPTYRVEHRDGPRLRVLGELVGVPAHPATLDPFVSTLLRAGDGGELRLVDAATGAVVARRRVVPFRSKAGTRFRPPSG
jgi:hypothetical protein